MQMLLYHIIYLIQYQVLHTASSANDLHCKAGDFNTLNCLTKKKNNSMPLFVGIFLFVFNAHVFIVALWITPLLSCLFEMHTSSLGLLA